MSYSLKKELLPRWLLYLAIASLFACSKKTETAPRRSPSSNPSSASVEKSVSEYQSKKNEVKKVNGDFDTYQNYESIDAPLTLKELKKNRRRPVLNVQELNSLMDKNFKNSSNIKNLNTSQTFEKASCTEEKCELKKVINYNKAIAKKSKIETPKVSKGSEVTKTDKENKDKQEAKANQNISDHKKSDSLKNTSNNKSTTTSKSISGKNNNHSALPPVNLPKTDISTSSSVTNKIEKETVSTSTLNPSGNKKNSNATSTSSGKNTSGKDKATILQNIKNTEPVFSRNFLSDQEVEAKPMPPVVNKLKVTSDAKNQTSGVKNTNSHSPIPPVVNAVPSGEKPATEGKTSSSDLPAPQFNKEENKGKKITLINKILINYYYKIKSTISHLFDKE